MGKKIQRVPKYFGFRIYLMSTILYFFLVFPVSTILLLKYGPEWVKEGDLTRQDGRQEEGNIAKPYYDALSDTIDENINQPVMPSDAITDTSDNLNVSYSYQSDTITDTIPSETDITFGANQEESEFGGTINLLLKLLVISFMLGFAFNLPFKIYFSRKRKDKKIPEKLHRFCKKFILKTPIINAGILFLAYGITLGYMSYILFIKTSFNQITQDFYEQFFFITLISSILALLFIYYWQKHRVHIKYLDHIFPKEVLRKRIFKIKEGRIRNRLWISSAMTTLLPLTIVVFYLVISISRIKEFNPESLTPEQINILVGNYFIYFGEESSEIVQELFYVNAFDSILMFAGIFSGILIAFIYILFFIRWTTQDIVQPVKELLENMQRTGRGELDSYSIVRTNDEIGELTEGYNDMSKKLNEYIVNISRINDANARFVPKQFLDFLGKDSISDIKLGDQVQQEMTILFTDIRDFTSLSEQMTPKENFNFLNNYLGYMEPVIRNNYGFIDKFMGDSIMALFPDEAENAINAAIEMRIKLIEFNHIISQFGQKPIQIGTGIHTGLSMLGVVGGEGRMDGTVISDAVNLSSRLEGLTKIYGSSIIISEDTLIKISDPTMYNYRFLDIVKVKGKKKAIYIFEIIDGEKEDIKALKIKSKPVFTKAVQLYKDKEFNKAAEAFKQVLKTNPYDKAATYYIDRCKRLMVSGNIDEWDGIEKF